MHRLSLFFTQYHIFLTGIIIFLLIFCLSYKYNKSYNFFVYIQEQLYLVILQLIKQNTSTIHIIRYLPVFLSTFILILCLNLIGLIPYSFTVTSHIFVTFSLAIIHFFAIILLGLSFRKFNFFRIFLPSNIDNKVLFIFILLIEILSYCIRPFSLAIRLFANMLAGHTLLYIISSFWAFLIKNYFITASLIIFLCCLGIFILEICICLIQAYVFTILFILFFNDIYKLNH